MIFGKLLSLANEARQTIQLGHMSGPVLERVFSKLKFKVSIKFLANEQIFRRSVILFLITSS